MSLTYLNGVEAELGKKSKAERKEARAERKEARKEKREQRKAEHAARKAEKKEKGGKFKKVTKGVAKIALAPARTAFLEATRLNFLKLAKRLKQAYEKDRMAVENFWSKFGGDTTKLKSAIEKGSKSTLSAIPPPPPGTGALIASATPIIIAVIKLFKELKSDKPEDTTTDEKAIDDLKDTLEADPNVPKDTAEMEEGAETGRITKEIATTTGSNMPIILGAAALGAFLLLRKK